MIYEQPSVYKNGDCNSIDFSQTVMDLYNDWENISNDFTLLSANVYKDGWIIGNVSDLGVYLSRAGKLIYFKNACRLVGSSIFTNSWTSLLRYDGTAFKTYLNTGDITKNPKRNLLQFPSGVARGHVFDKACKLNDVSNDLIEIDYPDPGLGARKRIGVDNTAIGFYTQGLTFSVELN